MTKTNDSALIPTKVEQTLKEVILKDLSRGGRLGWDRPHTEAVVDWMKKLLTDLANPNLNSQILITAAYAHDWGYTGLFGDKTPAYDEIIAKKALHMKRGAEMIERLLYQRLAGFFTEAEKLRVTHLVAVHDRVRELTAEDELLLMEADTLGMLNSQRVSPTISPQEEKLFLEKSIYNLRLPRFIHQPARQYAEQLLAQR